MGIGRATGYNHSRRVQRMSQDSSIRPTGKSEVMIGMMGLLSLLVVPAIILAMLFD